MCTNGTVSPSAERAVQLPNLREGNRAGSRTRHTKRQALPGAVYETRKTASAAGPSIAHSSPLRHPLCGERVCILIGKGHRIDDRLHTRRRGLVGCLHRAGAIAMGYWERLQKTDDKERRAQRGRHPAIWGAVFLVGIVAAWIWKLLVG